MVECDLFRFRAGDAEYPDHLAVGGDTVRAEISRRAHQKDVLLLLARKSPFLDQNRVYQTDLRLDQVRAHRLCAKKVRDETEGVLDVRERRVVGLTQQLFINVTHACSL